MLAVAVSARVHGRSEDRGYVVPQASDLAVAGDARWGSRPMAEHRVMSVALLGVTHYRSKRCYESHAMEQKTGIRTATPSGHPARRGHGAAVVAPAERSLSPVACESRASVLPCSWSGFRPTVEPTGWKPVIVQFVSYSYRPPELEPGLWLPGMPRFHSRVLDLHISIEL